jgi:hypothetical protein
VRTYTSGAFCSSGVLPARPSGSSQTSAAASIAARSAARVAPTGASSLYVCQGAAAALSIRRLVDGGFRLAEIRAVVEAPSGG